MSGGRGVRAVLAYSLARVLLLAASLVLLWLAGARGLLLILLAVLVSGLLSYGLLARQRDAMSAAITEWVGRSRRRLDAATTKEDAADDERRTRGDGG